MKLFIPSTALLLGLQTAFLNPVLALLLVALFDATAAEVGWSLALYSASGFIAALLVPVYADRTGDYLRPMMVCSALSMALAGALSVATSLPQAVLALCVIGGPANAGGLLMMAHVKASRASTAEVMNTRAIMSFAWVAGPPLATLIIGAFGDRAILVAVAVLAALNLGAVGLAVRLHKAIQARTDGQPAAQEDSSAEFSRATVGVIAGAFVALQATNSLVIAVLALFTTETLGLTVAVAGIALGVAAGLEIPALILIGRLSMRHSRQVLLASGCAAGAGYYLALAIVTGPIQLIAAQVLNAWFFAIVAGIGLTLFQEMIPKPGLATGLWANTRRVGDIAAGAIIAVGSIIANGYRGTFALCAALTLVALVAILVVSRGLPAMGPPQETAGT